MKSLLWRNILNHEQFNVHLLIQHWIYEAGPEVTPIGSEAQWVVCQFVVPVIIGLNFVWHSYKYAVLF